jgi:hypothetical protein
VRLVAVTCHPVLSHAFERLIINLVVDVRGSASRKVNTSGTMYLGSFSIEKAFISMMLGFTRP